MTATGSVEMTPGLARRRRRRLALWGVAVAATVGGELLVLLDRMAWPGDGYVYWLEPLLSGVFFTAVGVLITHRRPDHAIGDVFLATSLAGGLQSLFGGYSHLALSFPTGLPLSRPAALVANLMQFGFVLALLALLYLFPTGRLPGPRWRWPAGALGLAAVLEIVTSTFRPGVLFIGDVPNPAAWPAAMPVLEAAAPLRTGLMAAGIVGALAAPVLRYRRVAGVERLQLRWFAMGALAAIAIILSLPLFGALGLDEDRIGSVVWGIGPGMLPLAAGVAVLRYRLYDISHVVSRTISYALLTVLLVGAYLLGVVVLQRAVRPLTGGSDLAVAGSTLTVAALFQPLRRGIQGAVDHRFNRASYDAEGLVSAFGGRLRDQVDLGELRDDLATTVRRAIAPATLSVWLPEESGG